MGGRLKSCDEKPLAITQSRATAALTRWRKQYAAGVLAGLSAKAPGHKRRPAGAVAADMARLERENRRLQRQLEKAELIITFQKKACELLGIAPGAPPAEDEEC